jgi:hypothetical protein
MADFFGFSPIHVTEFKNLFPKVDFTERDRLKIVSNPVPSSWKAADAPIEDFTNNLYLESAKMNRACKQYKTNKLYQLLKLPLSSFYYQVKGKSLNNNTNAMIKFIKQTAIEVGRTYDKRVCTIL